MRPQTFKYRFLLVLVVQNKKEYYRQWKEKNKEHVREYGRIYRKKWRAKNNAHVRQWEHKWRQKHREEIHQQRKERRTRRREAALQKLALVRGRKIECMIDLTPDACFFDVTLMGLPCAGPIQIDHINGGGRKERKRIGTDYDGLLKLILSGEYDLKNLRLLCQLHNLLYRGPDERRTQ